MDRFVFSETPRDVLQAAAPLYADLAALQMQSALIKLTWKYRADQPRVPAGNPDGGQWTNAGGSLMDAAYRGPYRPVGNGFIPDTKYNPLDPLKLNKPLSAVEGNKIAGALTAIDSGSVALQAGTDAHVYKNLPNLTTGAVLPPSISGYKTYYIGPGDDNRRLVIDNGANRIYYTNNHYKSFRIVIAPDFRSGKSTMIGEVKFGEINESN